MAVLYAERQFNEMSLLNVRNLLNKQHLRDNTLDALLQILVTVHQSPEGFILLTTMNLCYLHSVRP